MTLALHPRSRHRHALPARPRPAPWARAVPETADPGALRLAPGSDAPALPAAALVSIGVVDPARCLPSLALALPDGWQLAVAQVGPLADALVDMALAGPDALLLVDADGDSVRAVRSRLPTTPIVALLPVDAPAGGVVDVLQAGADACVRGSDPAAVLVAHLRACLRRRSAST